MSQVPRKIHKFFQWEVGKQSWISSICCKKKQQNSSICKKKIPKFVSWSQAKNLSNSLIDFRKTARISSVYRRKITTKFVNWFWRKIAKFFNQTKKTWWISSICHQNKLWNLSIDCRNYCKICQLVMRLGRFFKKKNSWKMLIGGGWGAWASRQQCSSEWDLKFLGTNPISHPKIQSVKMLKTGQLAVSFSILWKP